MEEEADDFWKEADSPENILLTDVAEMVAKYMDRELYMKGADVHLAQRIIARVQQDETNTTAP